MAPRTRAKKFGKENNVSLVKNTNTISNRKVPKPIRKPLADKTNSASDENASILITKKTNKTKNTKVKSVTEKETLPRRERRLPTRYIGNNVLTNLSNNSPQVEESVKNAKSPVKNVSSPKSSLTRTSQKSLDNSLLKDRPKRISRLPLRLDDHSISPSKFIPVQPCSASTPLVQKQATKPTKSVKVAPTKTVAKKSAKQNVNSKVLQQKIDTFVSKVSPDSNNNPRKSRNIKNKSPEKSFKTVTSAKSPVKKRTLQKSKNTSNFEKRIEKSFTFRVLENKKNENNHENKLDVYEFTFDPTQEPKPQKKKRKRVVKKQVKPRTIVVKNNYDRNLAQTLQALKSAVGLKKPIQQTKPGATTKMPLTAESQHIPVKSNNNHVEVNQEPAKSASNIASVTNQDNIHVSTNTTGNLTKTDQIGNHASVRIEDIAAQFEPTPEHHDIDYSPVNSPNRCPLPDNAIKDFEKTQNDPLNLQQDLSFFDDQPVASSSMNVSARHPTASPWRVEFGNLPIKWKVNTYVKPNMTPAFECSYVDFDSGTKKKHVYTNILPEPNKSIPDAETISTHLKQTSIISFIKEVVNRSMNKKKKKAAITPTKQNSLFEDTAHTSIFENYDGNSTPRKSDSSNNQSENNENAQQIIENNKELSPVEIRETRKRKNPDPIETISKTPKKDNDVTLFGFDDSENVDQENVSPIKVVDKQNKRRLRSKARSALQEINEIAGPTRAIVPAKAKLAMNSEVVNKIYEEMKSADVAPLFPEKNISKAPDVTNVENLSDEESNSVHLFEDVELIHHLKPTRKSYGKAKKVTFRQNSTDGDSQNSGSEAEQDSYDDLADLSYEIPVVKAKKAGKKKMTKKQKISKKEEKEVEEWAAQFNSMCEDIDNVDLVVE